MNKCFAATAIVASLTAGAALPAKASVIPLGVFTASDTRSLAHTVSGKGSFTDDYTFTLATFANLTAASITNSFTNAKQFISGFSIKLFSGSVGFGTLVAASPTSPVVVGSTFEYNGLARNDLGVGSYYAEVKGSLIKGGKASYGGSLAVSAVPLPNSVALFGMALGGLGLAGALRRKSKVASHGGLF